MGSVKFLFEISYGSGRIVSQGWLSGVIIQVHRQIGTLAIFSICGSCIFVSSEIFLMSRVCSVVGKTLVVNELSLEVSPSLSYGVIKFKLQTN